MMKSLFINVFSSTVCDVILQEQKDKHVNEIYQLPCLKRKLVHCALFVKHNSWNNLLLHMNVG